MAKSQAHIKLEAFGLAIADATKAIELDSNNVKVLYTFDDLSGIETHNLEPGLLSARSSEHCYPTSQRCFERLEDSDQKEARR